MSLDERIIPYLQMAGLAHLSRLNDHWFRLDEPLVSSFVEKRCPETHTFHMPFEEYTIMLQDVAYQLGLPINEQYETFSDLSHGADEETVKRYTRAYITRLLSTQLLGDKSGTRMHIRWLPYVARLEDMGRYRWGSATLSWLYQCLCVVRLSANIERERTSSRALQTEDRFTRVRFCVDAIQLTGSRTGNASRNTRATTHGVMEVCDDIDLLCYHRVVSGGSVLSQLGGVQHRPLTALNIDFLMLKDGRGSNQWFPSTLQSWHIHWTNRM
ncbi:hypothetical protein Ahy_B07g087423 [Arachis hypogaea]|uniref:Aminotransferase-like plant mobile domain-containing protein n=1 Tax=Arachis hypogaea TaxID=3818 RepID=A0A444YC43_ARAHY|nr:hypothetical protein Ahy_B07g087423 [Arachis hypogaea]